MDKCFRQLNNPGFNRVNTDCYQYIDFPKAMKGWGKRDDIPIKTPPAGEYPYLEKLVASREFKDQVTLLEPLNINFANRIRGSNRLVAMFDQLRINGNKNGKFNKSIGKRTRYWIIPLKREGQRGNYGGLLFDWAKMEWELFTLPGVELSEDLKQHQKKILLLIKEKFKMNPEIFYQHVGFRPKRGVDKVATWWPLWLVYLKLKKFEKIPYRELRVNRALELLYKKPEMFDQFLEIFT
jgi:hypothetical protein